MIRNLAENDDLKMLKPNLIICLIQEDYDAAKPDGEMDEACAALRNDFTGDDWSDSRSTSSWVTAGHTALLCELFLRKMVLAEGDISPCKHRIHHVIEAMPTITYVTLLVNALFWSTLWSTH